MILYDPPQFNVTPTDNHVLPTSTLFPDDGFAVAEYIETAGAAATASFTAGFGGRRSWRTRHGGVLVARSRRRRGRHHQARRDRARRADPRRQQPDPVHRGAGPAVPGDPGHVDVEPARGRNRRAPRRRTSGLDAGHGAVGTDDDRLARRRQGGRHDARRPVRLRRWSHRPAAGERPRPRLRRHASTTTCGSLWQRRPESRPVPRAPGSPPARAPASRPIRATSTRRRSASPSSPASRPSRGRSRMSVRPGPTRRQ